MIKEILLHVGLHKTGTSSIQETLASHQNNKVLQELGFLYPKSFPSNHSIPLYSAFCDHPEQYHINIKREFTKEQITKKNETTLKKFEAEVINSNCEKLIISGEDISVLTHNNLVKLKEYLSNQFSHNIKVILYVRDPISWAVSDIQEDIKVGGLTYRNSYNAKKNLMANLFQQRVKKFIEIFQDVKVYKFEEAIQFEQGLIAHFLKNIGSNVWDANIKELKSNESLSITAADILSFINERHPLIINGRLNENRNAKDFAPLLKIGGNKFDISYEDKQELYHTIYEDIDWLKVNTGIDYKKKNLSSYHLNHELSDGVKEDIRKIYPKMTSLFKECIQEYLKNHNGVIQSIVQRNIPSEMEYDSNNSVQQLIKNLNLNPNIPHAEIYREIALFMEKHQYLDSAKVMMEKALELRPEGPFIKQKVEEYQNLLREDNITN